MTAGATAPTPPLDALFLRALAERSVELDEHNERVSALVVATADALGVPERERPTIVAAARHHDLGKIVIPSSILDKPGPLTKDERKLMRQHSVVGAALLSAVPELLPAAGIVRHHHEAYDGSGYPDGIAGEDIPLGARIVAVCDAYDAMVSERAYRKAMSHAAAIAELRRCARRQFDPTVIEALVATLAVAR